MNQKAVPTSAWFNSKLVNECCNSSLYNCGEIMIKWSASIYRKENILYTFSGKFCSSSFGHPHAWKINIYLFVTLAAVVFAKCHLQLKLIMLLEKKVMHQPVWRSGTPGQIQTPCLTIPNSHSHTSNWLTSCPGHCPFSYTHYTD